MANPSPFEPMPLLCIFECPVRLGSFGVGAEFGTPPPAVSRAAAWVERALAAPKLDRKRGRRLRRTGLHRPRGSPQRLPRPPEVSPQIKYPKPYPRWTDFGKCIGIM